MKRFTDLNSFGDTSVDIQDLRSAGIRYDTRVPFEVADDNSQITSTTYITKPAIDITEIINYQTANVQYELKIINAGTPALTGATISWADFPSTCTLNSSTNYYLVTGITDPAEWDKLGAFILNLPSNYANCPNWHVEATVIYTDSDSVEHKIVWKIYDPDNYYLSRMTAVSSASATVLKVKQVFGVNPVAEFRMDVEQGRKVLFNANLQSTVSMVCNGAAIPIILAEASLFAEVSMSTQARTLMSIQVETNSTNKVFSATISYIGDTTVDWGDGNSNTYTGSGTSTITHTYSGTAARTIKFTGGKLTKFAIGSRSSSSTLLTKILGWDDSLVDLSYACASYDTIQDVPGWLPNSVTNLQGFFQNCNNPTGNAWVTWDTSNVTDMSYLFDRCQNMNGDISGWNTGNVTTMNSMFYNCSFFNRNIGGWDTSKVSNMNAMFYGASVFDQDLSGWDVHLIPTKPTAFDTNTSVNWTTAEKPQWGTTGS